MKIDNFKQEYILMDLTQQFIIDYIHYRLYNALVFLGSLQIGMEFYASSSLTITLLLVIYILTDCLAVICPVI